MTEERPKVLRAFTVIQDLNNDILVLTDTAHITEALGLEPLEEQATLHQVASISRELAHDLNNQFVVSQIIEALTPAPEPTTPDKIRRRLKETKE
jgi:hypothetical protein